MCSVGDPFDFNMEGKLPVKNYVCKECGNKFKGICKCKGTFMPVKNVAES